MILAQLGQPQLGIGIGALVITWLALFFLWRRQSKELASMREALKGSDGQSLEQLLQDHLRSRTRLEGQYEKANRRLSFAEEWMSHAYARVGFVKFDAFDDTGGRQSFALALQNEKGHGVVVSSVAGRESTRVYGKSLMSGECEQTLTPEEQEAIDIAAGLDGGAAGR